MRPLWKQKKAFFYKLQPFFFRTGLRYLAWFKLLEPFISICIPAYKRVGFLRRLLDSIALQSYRHFEVVVSDDSDDDSVQRLMAEYQSRFPLRYYKNSPALGTPANWNYAISKAEGEWIKLVHDDDWFASANSLAIFARHAGNGKRFVFSAYRNIFTDTGREEEKRWKVPYNKAILREPNILLADNVIGPPSVTLVHRDIAQQYDERLKWRVDMEFYIRLLRQEQQYCYIDEPLVNVGISQTQVTESCIYNPAVELPEGWLLLEKHGRRALRNIWVYDAWWRLLRNMEIRSVDQLTRYVPAAWPPVIYAMVKDLSLCPRVWLKLGAVSKIWMGLSYVKNYAKTGVAR